MPSPVPLGEAMRRRDFIKVIGGAAATWPVAARAQQAEHTRHIGVMMGYAETDPAAQAQVAALRQGLQKLGWEEARNIRIDVRFPGGDAGAIRTILMELMSLTPDVLVTNTNSVTALVQAEVRNIPIVFISVGDPVGSGFVGNEAHPNGNLTGFANWEPSMSGKWLGLLKEVAPQIERVGFVMHPETAANLEFFKFAEAAAPALKVKPAALGVHDDDEIERALTAFASDGNGGIIVIPHALTLTNRDLIVALAARFRLPALYPLAFYAEAGGLISYGFNTVDQFQRGAEYVDRILRGAKPADLPVQYPTKFQLVVNLKTAKTLGLAIPESFLQRADKVIE
jgi:putative tryptophan/tyrosine transport system substrate-binding protein